jgi:hypothetical protein
MFTLSLAYLCVHPRDARLQHHTEASSPCIGQTPMCNVLSQIIAGVMFPGQAIANMVRLLMDEARVSLF